MSITIKSNPDGVTGAIQVNGVDKVVIDAGGIASGYKDSSITPAKLSGGQSGSAPAFAARAWCNADGTLAGTNAPRAGGNVTSVTRNGVGDYTINFTTAMPDTNYAVVGISNGFSAQEDNNAIRTGTRTTTSVQVRVISGNATVYVDTASLQIVIFR